jgi:hypothetical protein
MISAAFDEADRGDPHHAHQRVFLVDGNKQQITAITDQAANTTTRDLNGSSPCAIRTHRFTACTLQPAFSRHIYQRVRPGDSARTDCCAEPSEVKEQFNA